MEDIEILQEGSLVSDAEVESLVNSDEFYDAFLNLLLDLTSEGYFDVDDFMYEDEADNIQRDPELYEVSFNIAEKHLIFGGYYIEVVDGLFKVDSQSHGATRLDPASGSITFTCDRLTIDIFKSDNDFNEVPTTVALSNVEYYDEY